MTNEGMSYKEAGVDIDLADHTKKELAEHVNSKNPRVLSRLGTFASLFDISFPEIQHPVLAAKMEEPGSKQLLAAQHGRLPDVGTDLVHHLINDTIMEGARTLAVLDTIVCGKLEKAVVVELVARMAQACKQEGVALIGGETSEQPRVIPEGAYVLSAASIGIVDKKKIIDGSKIKAGDHVIAVASNGVHTNGYTLVRSLLDANEELSDSLVDGKTFLDQVLLPHLCYNTPLQNLFPTTEIHALAHITGGGIVDNVSRVIPGGLSASINLQEVDVLPIFKAIQKAGNVTNSVMLRTFNLGVGLVVIVPAKEEQKIKDEFSKFEINAYTIGEITISNEKVITSGALTF